MEKLKHIFKHLQYTDTEIPLSDTFFVHGKICICDVAENFNKKVIYSVAINWIKKLFHGKQLASKRLLESYILLSDKNLP